MKNNQRFTLGRKNNPVLVLAHLDLFWTCAKLMVARGKEEALQHHSAWRSCRQRLRSLARCVAAVEDLDFYARGGTRVLKAFSSGLELCEELAFVRISVTHLNFSIYQAILVSPSPSYTHTQTKVIIIVIMDPCLKQYESIIGNTLSKLRHPDDQWVLCTGDFISYIIYVEAKPKL